MLLEAPFTEEKIRALRVGEMVEISGVIYTGRDAVHKYLSRRRRLAGRSAGQHHLPLRAGRRARAGTAGW